MTRTTPRTRKQVLTRDKNRCISCGTNDNVTAQRRRIGHVETSGRNTPPTVASDLLTLCATCNTDALNGGIRRAIVLGWKIRANSVWDTSFTPYLDMNDGFWWLPQNDGSRRSIPAGLAGEYLGMAGALDLEGLTA